MGDARVAGGPRHVSPLPGGRARPTGWHLRRGRDGGGGLPLSAAATERLVLDGGVGADAGRGAGRLDRLGGAAAVAQRALLWPPAPRADGVSRRAAPRLDAAT